MLSKSTWWIKKSDETKESAVRLKDRRHLMTIFSDPLTTYNQIKLKAAVCGFEGKKLYKLPITVMDLSMLNAG